jgi:hypothetical protein
VAYSAAALQAQLLALLPPFPCEVGDEDNLMLQLTYNSVEYLLLRGRQ